MKLSKQAKRTAKQLFRICFVGGLLDEQHIRHVVTQLIARKPRGYLAVLSHFRQLVKLELARRTARVESVFPLLPLLQYDIRQRLTRAHGQGLDFSFVQNPALIAGLRVQVGSDVYDGSVRGRLDRLAESF